MRFLKQFFLFSLIFSYGCQSNGPVTLNTDMKVEFKTRTFGGGSGYLISNQGIIGKDGKIEFRDMKVEDAVKILLCDYQNINCNGSSSKVVIQNPNKTLANYVFIDDQYKDKGADVSTISQAIMLKLEEAKVLTTYERIKEVPRFIVEGYHEKRLEKLLTPKVNNYRDKKRCNANQNQFNRAENPSSAELTKMGTIQEFIGELSFCLGVDIFLNEELEYNDLSSKNMLFQISTTDSEKELISKLGLLGLKVKSIWSNQNIYKLTLLLR